MRFRLLLVTLLAVGAVVPAAAQASEQGAARHLQAVKGDTAALGQFLRAMPKGTDLHTHLSGAVYAESIASMPKYQSDFNVSRSSACPLTTVGGTGSGATRSTRKLAAGSSALLVQTITSSAPTVKQGS